MAENHLNTVAYNALLFQQKDLKNLLKYRCVESGLHVYQNSRKPKMNFANGRNVLVDFENNPTAEPPWIGNFGVFAGVRSG